MGSHWIRKLRENPLAAGLSMPNGRVFFVNGPKNISCRRLQVAPVGTCQHNLRYRTERDRLMTRKLMIVAACAATALLGSGIAHADPEPAPAPDPNGPKCWVTSDEGKQELTPCGWAYTEARGWYQVPPGFVGIP
ncbi:MAG: hypothetical protein QOE94_3126 [Mycobacterium sp.]|jgi:hypothetical protein|nr:hypothetical protein [Mycobacterium sp.]